MKLKVKLTKGKLRQVIIPALFLTAVNLAASLLLAFLLRLLSAAGLPVRQITLPELVFFMFLFVWQLCTSQILIRAAKLNQRLDLTLLKLAAASIVYLLLLFLIVS